MKDKELVKTVEDLKKRIEELEKRPIIIHQYIPQYYPIYYPQITPNINITPGPYLYGTNGNSGLAGPTIYC